MGVHAWQMAKFKVDCVFNALLRSPSGLIGLRALHYILCSLQTTGLGLLGAAEVTPQLSYNMVTGIQSWNHSHRKRLVLGNLPFEALYV